MRFGRLALVVALAGVVATACASPLGESVPECDAPSNSLILSVQAVPGTDYVPCIAGLKTGWEYQRLQAETGQSVFYLDSDRLGDRFLQVTLLPVCDTSGAVETSRDENGVPLLMDVEVSGGLRVTIVPGASFLPTIEYAEQLKRRLEATAIADQTITVVVDSATEDVSDRIKVAEAAGHAVIVVSARDAEDKRATLILPGTEPELDGLTFLEVTDELEDVVVEESYTGFWYFPFEGGCVIYAFDAHGSGIDTIEAEVQVALALYDVEPLRQLARDLGRTPP